MKKIFVFLILIAILIINSSSKNDFSLQDYFSGRLTVYTKTCDVDNNILPNITIDNNSNSAIGESMFFDNVEISNILNKLNAKVIFSEYISSRNLTLLYCQSPKIRKSVLVKNKQINLQIVLADDYVVIGWPLILGSF